MEVRKEVPRRQVVDSSEVQGVEDIGVMLEMLESHSEEKVMEKLDERVMVMEPLNRSGRIRLSSLVVVLSEKALRVDMKVERAAEGRVIGYWSVVREASKLESSSSRVTVLFDEPTSFSVIWRTLTTNGFPLEGLGCI